MKKMFALSLLTLLLVASSCATRTLTPWLAQKPLGDQGGILIWTKLDDQGELKGKYTCTLILSDGRGMERRLNIKPGENRHIVVADVGTYGFRGLECGLFSDFGLEMAPKFAVVAGHFSWVGKLELTLNDRKNLKWGYDKPTNSEAEVEFLALPEEIKNNLISGYSAVKIDGNFFKDVPENINVEARNLAAPLDPELVTFKGCFEVEESVNPLKMGSLKFSRRGLAPFEKSGNHAYTPALVKCLSDGLNSLPRSYFATNSEFVVRY